MTPTANLAASAAALPAYLAFLVTLLALIIAATWIYKSVTPYRELDLIRANNTAAALSLGGFMIGIAIALKTVAAGTGSLLDMVMWGAFALVTQLLVFTLTRFFIKDLKQGIEDGRIAYGVLLGAVSITTGIANAGALTY